MSRTAFAPKSSHNGNRWLAKHESDAQTTIWESLQAIENYIARDNPSAAIELWLSIDDQVSRLTDPNFPRRRDREQTR